MDFQLFPIFDPPLLKTSHTEPEHLKECRTLLNTTADNVDPIAGKQTCPPDIGQVVLRTRFSCMS